MDKPNKPKRRSSTLKKTRQNYLAGGLILIALFWSVLYLPNLRTSPPWYGDEILTLDIGKSLIRGEMVNRAMYCTFASFNYNYQPAFAFFVGLGSSLTEGDILGGRRETRAGFCGGRGVSYERCVAKQTSGSWWRSWRPWGPSLARRARCF